MSKFAVVFSSFKLPKQKEIPINHTGKTARLQRKYCYKMRIVEASKETHKYG